MWGFSYSVLLLIHFSLVFGDSNYALLIKLDNHIKQQIGWIHIR